MRRFVLPLGLLATVALARPARAGGFELLEESPAGTAMLGARTAISDGADADAVFYNPAALTFQRGLGLTAGGSMLRWDGTVTPMGGSAVPSVGTVGLPAVYVSDRLGPHFGVGVGVFSNFAEHLEYPLGWTGQALGSFLDLTTTTVNPSVSLRPIPQVSIGLGLDIVPSSLDWRHALSMMGGDGLAHSATTAIGLGANVGVLVRILPRWLTFGASYRSAIDLDFAGRGGREAPGMPATPLDVQATLPLPHNFTFALSSHPLPALTVDAEVHAALWSDLGTVTFRFTPAGQPTATPVKDAIWLNQRDTWGARLGLEYQFLDGKLPVRLGVGYDASPVRRGWLQPFTPDSPRALVGAGLGYHFGAFGVEAGYALEILTSRDSTYPFLPASYSATEHVLTLAVTARLEDLGVRVDLPDYKH